MESVDPRHHAVKFYGTDTSLFSTVASFLAQGLVDGNPAIMIATPAHSVAILEHLEGRLVDVARAQRGGQLIVLDAARTLAEFMDAGAPNPQAFHQVIGRVLRQVTRAHAHRTVIRAYGEMVDVLWKDGQEDAAIRLEMLWNGLVQTYGFALLCGYAMGNFFKQTKRFEEVCRQHTHVMPAGEGVGIRE